MAQATILRRRRAVAPAALDQLADVVEVTYSTPAIPPRQVYLPLELYRAATEDELAANARYQMLPVDETAQTQEIQAIAADMKGYTLGLAQTLEV